MAEKTLRIGLISDTHMPRRWRTLPPAVFDLFQDVNLILHAGDVGKLGVLNQLSAIAPVIAVHGNDEELEAVEALPYLQTIVLNRHRLVMCHSHYPDRQEELDSRKDGSLHPKFKRLAKIAQAHEASLMFFGHWHIPILVEMDDILLINAGALASGNYMTRQCIQTVAILELTNGHTPQITHYDLATKKRHTPYTRPDGNFYDALGNYSVSIVDETILVNRGFIIEKLHEIGGENLYIDIWRQLAEACWYDGQDQIQATEFLNALENYPDISETMVNEFRAKLFS